MIQKNATQINARYKFLRIHDGPPAHSSRLLGDPVSLEKPTWGSPLLSPLKSRRPWAVDVLDMLPENGHFPLRRPFMHLSGDYTILVYGSPDHLTLFKCQKEFLKAESHSAFRSLYSQTPVAFAEQCTSRARDESSFKRWCYHWQNFAVAEWALTHSLSRTQFLRRFFIL